MDTNMLTIFLILPIICRIYFMLFICRVKKCYISIDFFKMLFICRVIHKEIIENFGWKILKIWKISMEMKVIFKILNNIFYNIPKN